jgi:hypothetical protein
MDSGEEKYFVMLVNYDLGSELLVKMFSKQKVK